MAGPLSSAPVAGSPAGLPGSPPGSLGPGPDRVGSAHRGPLRRATSWVGRNLWWLFLVLLALATVLLHGYHGGQENLNQTLLAPSLRHPLGTDDLGRDVLQSVLAGLPWSVEVSALATAVAGALSLVVGIVAAWYSGLASRAALRLIDFYVAFPFVVLAIVLIGVVGRGTTQLGIILGLGIWPIVARIVYSEARRIKEEEFVVYARVVWHSDIQVIVRHVVPSLFKRFAVVSAFVFGDVLGASAALAFLGIGPPLGTPNWGSQIASGQQYLSTAPWIAAGPGAALVILVVLVNLLADRVR